MTHDTPIRVEHVGIAVEDFHAAETVLHALGARQYVDDTGPDDGFRWAGYLLGDASRLELVTPLADDNFIREFLDRHGPGLHHVALATGDIEGALADARTAGVELVDESPRAGAWGHDVAFCHPESTGGVLVEFVEH